MWQNDLQHTGNNSHETILTPALVGTPGNMGQLFAQTIDGESFGQPLIAAGVTIGGTTHNVVYVATEHDSIYAFDADTNTGANANPLWHDSLLPAGTRPVPQSVVGSGDISVELGITTTPVIDKASNTIYIVSKVQTIANTTYQQYLHALDLSTGAEKFGGPVLINPTFAGSANDGAGGVVPFSALHEHCRAAMILYNGVVYISYASHSDTTPYHGEILGYNATTLALVKTFIATPNGGNPEGGFWGGGSGPAIDVNGNMFVAVANGAFDQTASAFTTGTNWGESMLKLPTNTTGAINVPFSNTLNWFTPNIWQTLNNGDLDLGSSGLLLLPDQAAGPHTHILVGGGKGAVLYVVDRDNMGGLHTPDTAIQEIAEPNGNWLFVTPAYFNNNIYYAAAGGHLEQRAVGYNATDGSYIAPTPIQSTNTYSVKGRGAFISSNGTTNGVVWILTGGGINAYNATNVSGAPIYSANMSLSGIVGLQNPKFSLPTVANGKVYFTAFDSTNTGHLFYYGLLSSIAAPVAPGNVVATANSSTQITVTWADNSNNESGFKVKRATAAAGPFTLINTTVSNATSFIDTGLTPDTTYYYQVVATDSNGDSAAAASSPTSTFPAYAPAGLVAYWNLDEDSTQTSAHDSTGNNHTGTVNGEAGFSTGFINNGIDLHGTGFATSNISVPNSAAFQFSATQSFTLSAWVDPGNVHSVEQAIIAKSADQGNAYGIWINAANKWVFRGPGGDLVGSTATQAWTHVAVVQDGAANTRKIYVNGALVATGTAQVANGAGALWIGQQNISATPDSFPGVIDEVRLYNRALAASEITTLLGPPILEGLSNQSQGGATYGLLITPLAIPEIEPRKGSTFGTYNIVLSFSAPVTGVTASLGLQGGGSAIGTVSSTTYDSTHKVVTVKLTGVGNAQALNLHLTGITPGAGTADIPLDILWGDVNADNAVTSQDVTIVQNAATTTLSTTTAFYDLNCDGKVDSTDTAIVSALVGTSLGNQIDTNLALFAPALASTTTAPNVAANAFDGNSTGTRWESVQGVDPQWISVDLGTISTIHSIVLNWETAAGANYNLQVSNDNATWNTIVPVTGNTTSGVHTYSGLSATGRYVRMDGLTRTTGFGYSLWEFQVFGIAGTSGGGGGNAPVITSATTASGTVGTAFSYQTTATNSPTSYAKTGTLPAGLTLNTTSGLISGTPTTAGTSTASLTATNAVGTSPAVSVTFTISATGAAPTITSATTAAATVGTAFTYQTTATNTPTSFALTGTLPAGLSFSTTTGAITGTPTAAGTSTVNLTATNASGTSPAVALTITVTTAGGTTPAITSATTASAIQKGLFTYQITASNVPTGYGASNLPAGLTVNTTTGLISGTPTASGTTTIGLTATNASGTSPVTNLTLTVAVNNDTNLALTGTATATSVTGNNTAALAIDGNGGTRWESLYTDPQSITVDLGAVKTIHSIVLDWETAAGANYNLAVSTDNATWTTVVPVTGNTTGGAKIYTGLNASARYVKMDGFTRATQYGYSLWEFQIFGVAGGSTVPAITSATTASATVGSVFSYQTTATNTPTSFAETGTLPAGLTFSTTTGVISGTPTTAGTSNVSLTATNASGTSPAVTLTITVTASGDTNVALNKTATASSFQAGNLVANGNDGSATTRWAAADATFPQWWMVDLGASKTLSHVDINWFSNTTRSYKYKIEVSADNATFTTAVDKTNNTLTGATSDAFTGTARYVRITVTGASGGFASAYEFAVFGH